MKDYPEMKMFTDERLGRIIILAENTPTHIFIVVSPFDPGKTEEENVRAVHDLYPCAPGRQASPNMIYGDARGESFGVIVFRPSELQPTLDYCMKIVEDRNQPGLITWTLEDGGYFIAADGTATRLSKWNRTIERLEEWCRYLRPGFKIQGTWNRGMTYVHMREAQLDGRLPRRNN